MLSDAKGALNNYVDKKGWVGGQSNVYVCLCGVGGFSEICLHRHFPKGPFISKYLFRDLRIGLLYFE